jgi:hypothetical protein
MEKRTIIVPRMRAGGVETVAVVRWTPTKKVSTPFQLMTALEKACTCWANETEIGRGQWHGTNDDFNVGDLSLEDLKVGPLADYLLKEDVEGLEIECFDATDATAGWSYDLLLVNEDKIDEDRELLPSPDLKELLQKQEHHWEGHCPQCGATLDRIEWDILEAQSPPYQQGLCQKCGCEFTEVYKYSHTEVNKVGEGPAG